MSGCLTMFPASFGDALVLEWGAASARRRLVVDGGFETSSNALRAYLEATGPEQPIELLVVTHIDRDHITGVLPLLDNRWFSRMVREVWFNSKAHLLEAERLLTDQPAVLSDELGAYQGGLLSDRLVAGNHKWNTSLPGEHVGAAGPPVSIGPRDHAAPLPEVELPDGLILTLLSPSHEKLRELIKEWDAQLRRTPLHRTDVLGAETEPLRDHTDSQVVEGTVDPHDLNAFTKEPFQPDREPPNGSSVAFLAEYCVPGRPEDSWSVLLTGDAHPELLAASINRLCGERGIERLAVDVVKIPHHGAAGNTSDEFLATVDCPVWLVSTNGRVFGHPSATAIARILSRQRNPTIGFNYRSRAALWTDVAATGACTIVQPDIGRDGTLVVELPLTSSAGKLGDS